MYARRKHKHSLNEQARVVHRAYRDLYNLAPRQVKQLVDDIVLFERERRQGETTLPSRVPHFGAKQPILLPLPAFILITRKELHKSMFHCLFCRDKAGSASTR